MLTETALSKTALIQSLYPIATKNKMAENKTA